MTFIFRGARDNYARKGVEAANKGNFQHTIHEIKIAFRKGITACEKSELLTVLGRAYNEIRSK